MLQVPKQLSFLHDRASRRRLLAVTLIFATGGACYGIFGPKWYRASVTIVPARGQSRGGIAGLLGGEMASLASAFDAAATTGSDAVRITEVLRSNAVTDAVIEKFDLRARYAAKFQEGAREAVWEHCSVRTLPKPNLVEMSCEDREPVFLREMLGYFVEFGNQAFRRVNVSSASEEVRFLEGRVADLREQAESAANRMRAFQERHQIVDLDSQARALVNSLSALEGQRMSRKMELDYARAFSSPEEAGAKQIRSQLSVVDGALRELEGPREPEVGASGDANRTKRTGILPRALAVPQLRAEYESLFRDRKVAEATLLFALERLEGAKANEARDVSTFQVLDPPTVPTRKSRPQGKKSALVGALIGLALGLAWEAWRNQRHRSGTAAADATS